MRATHFRFRFFICCMFLALLVSPLRASTPDSNSLPENAPLAFAALSASQIAHLQEQITELEVQLELLKREINALKAQSARAPATSRLAEIRAAAARAAASARSAQVDTPDAGTRFTSGTRMQPQLNPEISVTGNMFARGGDDMKEEFSAGGWDLDIQSYLDPYSRAHFVLGVPEGESPELEEAYITWFHLPGGLGLTAGKKRAQFGVLNRWHKHALDQVDAPWVLEESFGEEGLSGTGVSLAWMIPHPWASANELTVEVSNGDNEVAFAGADWHNPALLARLKNYFDLNENSYLEIGLTGLNGEEDRELGLDHHFAALDFSYDWYPAGRELYREFLVRGMLLRSVRERDGHPDARSWGGYAYAQFKFSPHWITGLRFDRVDDQHGAQRHVWGLSPYLTFWQSEFVRLRAQMSYRDDSLRGIDRKYWLQITLAAGPHKHENY